MKRVLTALLVFACAVPLYTAVMARLDLVTPPDPAAPEHQADLVHIDKSERRMTVFRGDRVLGSYPISLGKNADDGHKTREGDERTPEGSYIIDWRNAGSFAYLSLHISYPNAQDIAAAEQANHNPGGMIMIHGIANGWGWLGTFHLAWDWTDGCIAITNREMREVWSLVPNGTPIEIEA